MPKNIRNVYTLWATMKYPRMEKEATMNCPSCNDVNLVMAERQGIEIDYCPNCRGVWLDRGELDKIIERTPSSLEAHEKPGSQDRPQQSGGYRRQSEFDDRYYRRKKKRGLLGELFDFD